MKISLLNPQIRITPKISIKPLDVGEHIGLGILASVLRKEGHDVQIIYEFSDKIGIERSVVNIDKFNPDLIGISLMSQTYPAGMLFANSLKERLRKPIVVGGILPTILKEVFLKEFDPNKSIDFLVVGDGEKTLVELVKYLSDNKKFNCNNYSSIPGIVWRKGDEVIQNELRPFIRNLDQIPFPARDYAPIIIESLKSMGVQPALRIISSRGCYGRCLFCHILEYYRAIARKPMWRYRSAVNIVEEIKQLKRKYQVKHFLLSDDNFFGYGSFGLTRVKQFADLLIRKRLDITFSIQSRLDSFNPEIFRLLKEAGLISVDFGIETIKPESLRFFQKDITLNQMLKNFEEMSKISGIAIGIYMLNIHPLSTIEETSLNYHFLNEIGYFEGKDFDKEIYRKLIASVCEITKYTRMYYIIQSMKLLGDTLPQNPVMYKFHFKDSKMTKFYKKIIHYVQKFGLKNFGKFFTDMLCQSQCNN